MKAKFLAVTAMLLSLALVGPGMAMASIVTDEVRKTVDEVVKIVTDKNLKKPGSEQKRRSALKQTIGRIFNYGEMAKRSMGVHWKNLNPADQKEFTGLFATLLENSYAGKIESYNNEKIVYEKELVDGDHAEVGSRLITAKRDEYELRYRLLKAGSKWMVYDVVIEGVSMVSNYRSQFNKIINEKGYKELLKKMRTKSDELEMT
jgi:phospholipid transport system substrate-binding protein